MVLYAVVAVLVLALVAASAVALMLGLLGEVGVFRMVRCASCGHLVVGPGDSADGRCPHCRHEHLAHPRRTLRHPGHVLARH